MSTNRSAFAALAVAAFLFGLTFAVVKEALETFPPFAFIGWRFLLAGVVLSVFAFPGRADVWRDGTIAGLFLFAGYAMQTVGLTTTGASNSALITGLYVVLTPIVVAATQRKAPTPIVTIGVMVAFAGIALLTATDGLRLDTGDLLTLGCAFAFAGHIAYLSRASHRHPVVPFAAVQMLVTAILAFPIALINERGVIPDRSEWPAVILTGVGVSALAYLLQIWAQSRVDASRAAIVLSLEPVFAVLVALLLLDERLGGRGWAGAVLVMFAIYLVLSKEKNRQMLEAELVSPPR